MTHWIVKNSSHSYPIQLLTHLCLKESFYFFADPNLSLLESKVEIKNEEPTFLSFMPLKENEFKFVVSFGYFMDKNYLHNCFAVMISPLFGLTSTHCLIMGYLRQ